MSALKSSDKFRDDLAAELHRIDCTCGNGPCVNYCRYLTTADALMPWLKKYETSIRRSEAGKRGAQVGPRTRARTDAYPPRGAA